MDTSKYPDRKQIKRDLRSPNTEAILAEGRKQREALEAKLGAKTRENAALRKVIQEVIDSGTWNAEWEKLGFKKKGA